MASILPSLNREDRALVAWYLSLYAPRAGGAYDSHHRTAGIAGRTRRRGGSVAAGGARAAGEGGNHRIARNGQCGGAEPMDRRLRAANARSRLGRRPQSHDRISLGGGTQRTLREFAAEFVRLKVDVILTHNTPPVIAAKQATSVIPIVFATAADPVDTGLVA